VGQRHDTLQDILGVSITVGDDGYRLNIEPASLFQPGDGDGRQRLAGRQNRKWRLWPDRHWWGWLGRPEATRYTHSFIQDELAVTPDDQLPTGKGAGRLLLTKEVNNFGQALSAHALGLGIDPIFEEIPHLAAPLNDYALTRQNFNNLSAIAQIFME
jgi:hypothetical protein